MRIISLAPTQTEIIASLGKLDWLMGITENCDFPESISGLPTYGSWYAPDLNRVMEAKPDLVCTFGKHQEEMAQALREAGFEAYHSDPGTVGESLATFLEMAEAMDCPGEGLRVVGSLQERLDRVALKLEKNARGSRPSVFRIMHWRPLITIGPGAFQFDVVEVAGGRNLMLPDGGSAYFVCEPGEAISQNPEVIFFCEPFIEPILQRDPLWQKVSAVKNGRIFIFDCGLTCRSGPRIVDMVEELAKALHPECNF